MTTFFGILIAILMLGVLIIIHEMGHFFVGRLCGIGIEEVGIGFGPKLIQRTTKKGLQVTWRLLPFGAFVRFTGEDESSDNPKAMNNQPVWKRLLTVLAGPMTNIVFAMLIIMGMLMGYGILYNTTEVVGLMEGLPAQSAGLQVGDVITAVGGVQLDLSRSDMAQKAVELIQSAPAGQPVDVAVKRGKEEIKLSMVPQENEEGEMLIGIYLGQASYKFNVLEAAQNSGKVTWSMLVQMLTMLKDMIFAGQGLDQVMGPVGTIGFVSQQVTQGFQMFLNLTFIISLNLGVMNLLPIPALDGGRILFLLVEAVRRKPINPDKEGLIHLIGFGVLILIILGFTFQDIMRWFKG